MSYVVRVCDRDQGYQDESVYGAFRTRETAEAFAAKIDARFKNEDLETIVSRVQRPTITRVRAEGWFDA